MVSLPASKSLTLNWNYGSMLLMVLGFQIFTGTFLSFYYSDESIVAFSSVQYVMYEVNFGWLFRLFHSNGASLFFIFLYLHLFKGLFFSSYRLFKVWFSGLTIMLLLMMEAFMGYVLVWAQMSFWASVVITSLLSVIPIWGESIVTWIWGGFIVSGATLKFFFVLHFLLPWGLLVLVLAHMVLLHETGSTSVLFCCGDYDKVGFFPLYWVKDLYNILFWLLFLVFVFVFPYVLGDPEMFIEADTLMSPVHIVPEWYFLFAYAILRAIPNKVLGVLSLLFSVAVFYFFLLVYNYHTVLDKVVKFLVFIIGFSVLMLSWLGQCYVEEPFILLSEGFSVIYFVFVILLFVYYYFMVLIFK
uniref:Cytochrome b n=1 Tax=Gnathostoma doloresi TaxID=279402 RepID=A0A1J0M4A9_9BILA|nr:cytochrome b [Gnathostoma doloresi]